MVTTAIVFDRRGKAVSGAEGALEIRVTIDRISKYFNTGIKVRRGQFVAGSVINRPDCQQLNERLAILMRQVQSTINDDLEATGQVDPVRLRRATWKSCHDNRGSVADWIERHIPDMRLKPKTAGRYMLLVARLREFGQLQSWDDLCCETIYMFNTWLHERSGKTSIGDRLEGRTSKISDAGVYNYHKCLKASINLAVRMEVIESNPYEKLRGEFKRGEKILFEFLTEGQMKALCRLNFLPGSTLASARDLAIVQMYTGMAWADLSSFDIHRYSVDDSGHLVASGQRVKTNSPYVSQLLPPVMKILERYGGQLPLINQWKYNDALKVIGDAIGLNFALHSHALRYTYATWALRNKVPVEIVARMLGHKDIAMTLRYAKILAVDVCHEYNRLAVGL